MPVTSGRMCGFDDARDGFRPLAPRGCAEKTPWFASRICACDEGTAPGSLTAATKYERRKSTNIAHSGAMVQYHMNVLPRVSTPSTHSVQDAVAPVKASVPTT